MNKQPNLLTVSCKPSPDFFVAGGALVLSPETTRSYNIAKS